MRPHFSPCAMTAGRAVQLGLVLASIALAAPASAQSAPAVPYKVIVNASNPIRSLRKAELARIFLKKIEAWESGALVVPIDQPERAPVRQTFSREVLGKPPAAVKSYWNQLVFSGRSVPPAEKMTDAEVINFVRNTPSAVGYVAATTSTKGVKVLAVAP